MVIKIIKCMQNLMLVCLSGLFLALSLSGNDELNRLPVGAFPAEDLVSW